MPPAPPPPTLWEWITTAGTLPGYLTAVVALFAATFAYRSSKASRRSADIATAQFARLETDREREQADGFAVWSTGYLGRVSRFPDGPIDPGMTIEQYSNVYAFRFYLRNASALPIYDVTVYAETDVSYLVGRIAQVPPDQNGPTVIATSFVAKNIEDNELMLGVLFVDVQGHYWIRQSSGRLDSITKESYDSKLQLILKNSVQLQDEIAWARNDRERLYDVSRMNDD